MLDYKSIIINRYALKFSYKDYSGRSAHARKRVQRTGIAV